MSRFSIMGSFSVKMFLCIFTLSLQFFYLLTWNLFKCFFLQVQCASRWAENMVFSRYFASRSLFPAIPFYFEICAIPVISSLFHYLLTHRIFLKDFCHHFPLWPICLLGVIDNFTLQVKVSCRVSLSVYSCSKNLYFHTTSATG